MRPLQIGQNMLPDYLSLKNPYIQGTLIGWTICAAFGVFLGIRSELRDTDGCSCKK